MKQAEKDVLSLIETPSDIKKLNRRQLRGLAKELRSLIIDVTTRNGGHLASSLGTVELTLAIHRALDLPQDSVVWDVGHQTYTHKILVHGKTGFETLRQKGGISGFSRPDETRYDAFVSGHASNSISAALGLLEGKRLSGKKDKVVAVIGDGALTGGMTFEAFNHAGFLKRDLIVILNDNAMSIGKNVGALSSHTLRSPISSVLTGFAVSFPFFQIRHIVDSLLMRATPVGRFLFHIRKRLRNALKALLLKENLFANLGFIYVGPIDGHNERRLEKIIHRVKRIPLPVLIHVVTKKGKGLPEAEADPVHYHGIAGHGAEGCSFKQVQAGKSFTKYFSEWMTEAGNRRSDLVAISAAMAEGSGLDAFRDRFPERFYDTGITEEHAVTFAAGLAKAGLRPIVAIYSTFMQRAVDQVIHDVAIQKLPVIFVLDRAGLVGGDGETHQGIFDIALYRVVPDLDILLPSTRKQLREMLDYALTADHPVMLRIAKEVCPETIDHEASFQPGRGAFVLHREKADRLMISCGSLLTRVIDAAYAAEAAGVIADVYDLRSLKPLDRDAFVAAVCRYRRVDLFEDAASVGGAGEALAPLFLEQGMPEYFFHGIPSCFPLHATRDELLEEFGFSVRAMTKILTGQHSAG